MLHYLDNSLDLNGIPKVDQHAKVGRDGLPCLGYKDHRCPSFQELQI